MMAFCWKFCGNIKVSFGLLLLFFILTEAQNCNYFQNLENGITYYAYNPEYPSLNEPSLYCVWRMTNSYPVELNCNINILQYDKRTDCRGNRLSIQFEHEVPQYFCGKNTSFIVKGMNPIIRYTLSSGTGRFLCSIKAEEFDKNCSCGWKKVTRIVGGNETGVNEYPMMAGIVSIRNRIIFCGGCIISERHILTAGHCVHERNISETVIVVGEHDVTTGSETNATKLFRIISCVTHPNYSDINGEIKNDIAICTINGLIKYSAEVGPACLPFQHQRNSFGGVIVIALGWGLTSFGGAKSSTLQKVPLNVMKLNVCKRYYSDIDKTYMCTFTPEKDTCQMDSGGPLLWRDPTTHKEVLVGITSSGVGCASDYPTVNMRTGAFIDWIVSVTPGANYCKAE